MSFETIKIVRQIPIINGFLQCPPNLESLKTSKPFRTQLTSPSLSPLDIGGKLVLLGGGSGGQGSAGQKFGMQEFIETPGISISNPLSSVDEIYNDIIA